MVITLSPSTPRAYEFACHSAACRPPGSGGTGGSTKSGAAPSLPSIRAELRQHRGLKSDSSDSGMQRARQTVMNDLNNPNGHLNTHKYPNAGVTPQQARQTVMNDLNKRSKVQSAKNLEAQKAKYGSSGVWPRPHSAETQASVARINTARANGGHTVGTVMAKAAKVVSAGGVSTSVSRRGGFPQVATVRQGKASFKNSAKATATPENFPRGDKRKGPPHSQTFISGQQKNSPWNLTVTKGRGKTVIGKGRPVTKDGGFYGAKLIKAKPKLTGLGREPKFKEPTPIPSKAQRDASRKKSNEAYDAMPKSSKEILRRIAEWNSKP